MPQDTQDNEKQLQPSHSNSSSGDSSNLGQSPQGRRTYATYKACVIYALVNIAVIFLFWEKYRWMHFEFFYQVVVFGWCVFLCVVHWLHWFHCEKTLSSDLKLDRKNNPRESQSAVGKTLAKLSHDRWTLSLVTITLPLALSLVSELFGHDGILELYKNSPKQSLSIQFSKLAFHFSESIFFVMLTLEIAYLYDLKNTNWRNLITASIILNLIGFSFFLVIGEPNTDAVNYHPLTAIVVALSGISSLIASFRTILYSRVSGIFNSQDIQKIEEATD